MTKKHTEKLPQADTRGGPFFGNGYEAEQLAPAKARLSEYETVIDGLDEMILVLDRDYRYLIANRAFLKYRKLTNQQVIGRRVSDVVEKELFEREIKPKLESCFRGNIVDYSVRHEYSDLGLRDIMVSYSPIYGAHGVEKVICILKDVTQRRQAEEALRVSRQKYKNIFSFAPVGIYQALDDGTIITANQTMATMLGYDSPDELLQVNLEKDVYFNPDDRHELIITCKEMTVVKDAEVAWRRKDGSPIWIQLEAHVVRNEDGTTDYCEGFVRNVTEQHEAREALRESEERYRELFENSKDAIYIHDLNGRYTSANRAAEELTGFHREEIIGRHYSNFIAPRYLKEAREKFCLKFDVPIETTYEAEVVCKSGARKPVEVTSRMIYKDEEVVGVQGTVRDITERKRAQDVLQTYSRRLLEAQETERHRIARELHDEIGQVLTAVRLNLESIKGSSPEASNPRIDESMRIVDHALRQVRELSLELRPSMLDDLGLLAALRWFASRYTSRSGILAAVTCDTELKGISHEVSTACFRIAQEALTNSARHSKATKANITVAKRDGELSLNIRDDGVGFDPSLFLNGMASHALGLRGMHERALAVNGHIEINSQIGKGTEVVVIVPLQKTSARL